MEEIEKLVAQVKILGETVTAVLQRQEQIFKMQEERAALLHQTAGDLKQTIENLSVTDEALKRALSEADQQIDDLSKITAALVMLQRQKVEA